MQQSSILFFFLFAGFMIYITAKGELPLYLAVFTGKTAAGTPTRTGGAQPGTFTPSAGTVAGDVGAIARGIAGAQLPGSNVPIDSNFGSILTSGSGLTGAAGIEAGIFDVAP